MQPSRVLVVEQGKELKCDRFFLDSGAHSIHVLEVLHKNRHKNHKDRFAYYETDHFWKYVDDYCDFLLKHQRSIDFYANVDVIFSPELSWKVLKYMESRGLHPVPVLHHGTDVKWFVKHVENGYKYIGIGGVAIFGSYGSYRIWADRIFSYLCPAPTRLPVVRTHGFAVTSYELLLRYPWYSVDSASWAKAAGFGSVYVPHKRNGKFDFSVAPYAIGFSYRSEAAKSKGRHFSTLSKAEKQVVLDWLEEIEMPLGTMNQGDEVGEYGVFSQYHARATANLKFFERLMKWMPKYPWPFQAKVKNSFF
jgi:hypothetical protein